MTDLLTQPRVQWVTASPLWSKATGEKPVVGMRQPAMLRFESDRFMDELLETLQGGRAAELSGRVATRASYQGRPLGKPVDWTPSPLPGLKLYQPVHGHFNLVAASLVCQIPGLPDRAIDPGQEEKVGFVLRRLSATGQELAWVNGPVKGWQPIALARALAENEELAPLVPVAFADPATDRRRRMLVGLIPTAAQETFQGAPALALAAPDPTHRALADEVYARVIAPLIELTSERAATLSSDQQRAASRFILLDLADFLAIHLPDLWKAIEAETAPALFEAHQVYSLLAASVDGTTATSWRAGLRSAWAQADRITGQDPAPSTVAFNLRGTPLDPDELHQRLAATLNKAPASASSELALTPIAKLDPRPETRYVVRCVFRRPHCSPLQPDVVSDPSEPFTIASFFDFDAPARPIRITMPVDTSPAGLRKFRKNVSFQISDALRKQMESVTDLNKVLDGDVDSVQGIDLGVLCSFSIPIITICALVVLIIFINLLNIVFWWLPFFRICLPIKLKAK